MTRRPPRSPLFPSTSLFRSEMEARLTEARAHSANLTRRPRVFFEEWDEPLISAIGWVSELVEIAGGIDVFPERARQDRKSTRLNSSHSQISYAVFCLKKKNH